MQMVHNKRFVVCNKLNKWETAKAMEMNRHALLNKQQNK